MLCFLRTFFLGGFDNAQKTFYTMFSEYLRNMLRSEFCNLIVAQSFCLSFRMLMHFPVCLRCAVLSVRFALNRFAFSYSTSWIGDKLIFAQTLDTLLS